MGKDTTFLFQIRGNLPLILFQIRGKDVRNGRWTIYLYNIVAVRNVALPKMWSALCQLMTTNHPDNRKQPSGRQQPIYKCVTAKA